MVGFTLRRCELGVATAATQIEGGHADTNWHRWAVRGASRDGTGPTVAADHWHRVEQDADLLTALGVRYYRMGLEWARVEPEPGVFDAAAVRHYRDELASLFRRGIRPLVTLHHFSEPGWFSERGGFLAADAVERFLGYVQHVVTELGDLVDEWVSVNEPNVYAYHCHFVGVWPPERHTTRGFVTMMSRLAEAHVRAYQLIHRIRPSARVGAALHLRVFDPVQPHNPFDRVSASAVDWVFQGALAHALHRGRFLAPLVQPRGIRPGHYYDFVGISYQSRSLVSGPADLTASGVPVNDLGWEIHPDGLIRLATAMHLQFPGPVYITENGTADASDAFRPRFLYDHLARIAHAPHVPIERYYYRSLTDDWEWAEGQTPRFGLVALDFATQERTIRPSGRLFAAINAHGGVTDDDFERYVAGCSYRRNG